MPYITLEIELCEDDARLLNTLCINGKDEQDVIVELIRRSAQQSGQRTCDHTCPNCGQEMQLVCFSSCGT